MSAAPTGRGLAWRIAVAVHRCFARPPVLAQAYIAAWTPVLRHLVPLPWRRRIAASLGAAGFPPLALPARAAEVAPGCRIRVRPHPGALDFPVHFDALRHEPEVYAALAPRVAGFDTVIEIGSNVGLFSVFIGTLLRDARRGGRLLCFEPAPDAFRMLLENLAANGLANVTATNEAVDEHAGARTLYDLGGGSPTSSFVEWHARHHGEHGSTGRTPVPRPIFAIDGAELMRRIPAPGRMLIKIDAELAEPAILRGLEGLIREHRPELIFEVLEPTAALIGGLPFLARMYRYHRITPAGLEPVEQLRAGRHRDYWLIPRT